MDIKHFYRLLLSSEHFTVAGNEFCLESSLDEETCKPVYQLYRCFIEMFTDDETGASVPITRFALLLEEDSWQTLYAKTRTFIYLNYVHGHSIKEKYPLLKQRTIGDVMGWQQGYHRNNLYICEVRISLRHQFGTYK